jgi:indolepyruvate decarboxylase
MIETTSVANYLLQRLEEIGLKHMFSVPGDYVLDFMDNVLESDITLIGNCNELNAGYAADAYARLSGIGAVCVTYGVGGLSVINAASGAYAERVPLVFISGAPNSAQRIAHLHMHHLSTSYNMQWEMYQKVTIDSVQLTNPHTAPDEIDRVLSHCLSEKLPVYIEIPVDMVNAPCPAPSPISFVHKHSSDPATLSECVKETIALIHSAKKPVIIAGMEVHRFGLINDLLALIEKSGIPFVSTIDGKSVLPEDHPQFIGVYMGALSREIVIDKVENSDTLISFGAIATDINTGGFTAHFPENNLIRAHIKKIKIGHHYYDNVYLGDYIQALTKALEPKSHTLTHTQNPHGFIGEYTAKSDTLLRVPRFYDRINRFIDKEMIILAETGDAMFAASELYIEKSANFISQAYYLSIGYTLPASLGACLAQPEKRILLLQGDGSFQMTAQELSTLIRHKCNPIIFLLNNDGYVIERLIHDGTYNNIQQWQYHKLPEVFGDDVIAIEVKTEVDLEEALKTAKAEEDKLVFINLHLPSNEGSNALTRLGVALRKLQTGN